MATNCRSGYVPTWGLPSMMMMMCSRAAHILHAAVKVSGQRPRSNMTKKDLLPCEIAPKSDQQFPRVTGNFVIQKY